MQKHYTGKQKAQIVLEILKEEKTVTQISSEYGVHSSQIYKWRRPSKNLDFSNAKPDARCPCGIGRKYKNCHGSKQKQI
jgi:transposase-like protein